MSAPQAPAAALTPAAIASDLRALQALPPSVLAQLIDPSAQPAGANPPDAATQLKTYAGAAEPGVSASLGVARAYAAEMRAQAERLGALGAVGGEDDAVGARLGEIRGAADEVRAAVEDYAAAVEGR
ncbi:uncharacterized protein LOC62_03G004981 [Vanrija pseudolonga]|uniref:Uncharacterized protein n=1 Tax=Vanrija pseudolonga TaxID=143232 RepID=A0AAF0YCS6_9TREE|nr:hypothetical protein LOC62_03G004981 [Vanrija pseudolonga]